MKNSIDYHKVLDAQGKLIGVLNINNHQTDSQETKHYKNLVIDQLNFCRHNQDMIVAKANKLYRMVNKKSVSGPLKRRCLNWQKLEDILGRFKL